MTASRWIAVSVAIGLVYYIVERRGLGNQPERSIDTDIWQGTVVGGVLGFISAQILARVWAVKVNGWTTMFGCGLPSHGMLFRAACAQIFPGPVNVAQEAMFGGREMRTTGDGFQVLFTGAARGVRCASAMIDAVSDLDIRIRAGLHTGDVELAAGSLHGITVHAAARVSALAGPGEVLVSAVTRDLLDGSGLMFEERGVHEVKGWSAARPVFALVRVASAAAR